MEELQIFRAELEKIVNELKEMEEKLRNPNLESPALKAKYQEKVKEAKVKQDDMIAYDKRTRPRLPRGKEIYWLSIWRTFGRQFKRSPEPRG